MNEVNPDTTETKTVTTLSPKNDGNLVKRIALVSSFVVIFLLGTITGAVVMNRKNTDENKVSTTTTSPTPTSTSNDLLAYSGGTITANFPKDWDVKEIFTATNDKNGFSSVDSKTTGLTGLEIYHNTNGGTTQPIFSLNALMGIGGMSVCPVIYKFSDTSTDYVKSIENLNKTVLVDYSYTTADFSLEKFSAVNLLGLDARIVYSNAKYNDIYFNDISGNFKGFNPNCNELNHVLEVPQISYTISNSKESAINGEKHQYQATYSGKTVTAEEARTLAQILNSLKAKK